ncbi:MAG: succinate dehydrogenase/fumarate reductase iron-sulfur subunit [Thermoleophilia bacterium]|nr:succinate dehydrogenase/fumarate reductase iron-sulfur subunit [Thermoleophilia bacterium]
MLVKLKIWRQTPQADGTFGRELVDYEVDTFEEATLLDVLDSIKHHQDGTLAYRKSCRMAICGSCGMRMDGRAVLACKTPMKTLAAKGSVPVIAPMGNMTVVRDLVTDMSDFWSKVRAMTPWLSRGDLPEAPADGREHLVSPEEQQKITKETMCIMCGCCVSECNSMEADPAFLGPAALAKGYRFVGDVRDGKTRDRLEQYNGKHGVWDCTRCYFCNERCPKGVDPRDAIAKLGAAMFDHGITSDRGAKHAKVFIDSAKGQGPIPGMEALYNGHLSETALIPLTLGAEALTPPWIKMGVQMTKRGKAPPPWHSILHRQKGLEEVRKLWRILEAEESVDRRGGDLETPPVPLPPNIAQGVRTQFTPEQIFERTGAVVSSDLNTGGGKAAPSKVDLADYYGSHTVVQQFVADGGLGRAHGLLGPTPTSYASQQSTHIDTHGSRPGATKDA